MADDRINQPKLTVRKITNDAINRNSSKNANAGQSAGTSAAAGRSAGNHGSNANNRRSTPKKKRSVWKTIRWFVIPALFAASLITGLILGYSYIGGEEASEVFQIETWKHMIDLIFAEE